MILKSYSIGSVNLEKLKNEVVPYIQNYTGANFFQGTLDVMGDAILDEAALDLAIQNHSAVQVPNEITPRQGRQALFLSGITDAMVVSAMNTLPSPQKELALIEWEYSTAFVRANPLMNQMGAALGLTPQDIDNLFIFGITL